MRDNKFLKLLLLGSFAIIGVIAVQAYWLAKSWDLKDQDFDTTMHIALRKVALGISKYNDTELPKTKLIQRRSSNIYAVNVNSKIDPRILEDALHQEFTNASLKTDFEYAVYDCQSDELVYGNYCKISDFGKKTTTAVLPRFDDLVYYFVVKLPQRESFLLSNLKQNLILTSVTILALLYFIYSILVITRQKKLSQLQTDFINNMTHEFKTPLSSIKIAAQALKSSFANSDNIKIKKYADIIYDQNERLNTQVERVLNVARIEGTELKLDKHPIDILPIVQKMVQNENTKSNRKMVSFVSEIKECVVLLDEVHFTNVVQNIIDNAIKYAEVLPLVHINLKLGRNQDEVELAISDNGIGIDRENFKFIFEKFFRVNTGNIHNVKGFGLGLFYVKTICDSHQWQVMVNSEVGNGSTFTLTMKRE